MNSRTLSSLSDRDLLAELRIFSAATTGAPADYALTAAQATDMTTNLNEFESELNDADAADAAEAAATNAKNSRREIVITMARQQFKLARAASNMSDENLGKANLDIYDSEQTDAPAPSGVPVANVDYGKLKHTIYFRDSATPDSTRKPAGMMGAEIWRYLGTSAPASADEYDYLATDTASPYVIFYDGADAGKKVFYQLRWVSKSGEKGEWSETVEATING